MWVYYLLLDQEAARAFSVIFHRFALCYAFYHLTRQHWGILTLYNKKAGTDRSEVRLIEGLLLAFGLVYPFAYANSLSIQQASFAETLPLQLNVWNNIVFSFVILALIVWLIGLLLSAPQMSQRWPNVKSFFFKAGFIPLTGALAIKIFAANGIQPTMQMLSDVLLIGFVVTGIWYIFSIFKWYRSGEPLNIPKLLFFTVVLLTNNFILHLELPLIMYVVCLTIFHNLQYHRIIRFHNVNKYSSPEAPQRNGFAVTLTNKLGSFAVLAIIFSLFYVLSKAGNEIFNKNEMLNYTISSILWGVAFHHYVLDSVIWKIKKSKNLVSDLKVAPESI
jgi:hypothetical protein